MYSTAINDLFNIHNSIPNNYVLKGTLYNNITTLNCEEPSATEELQSALNICNYIYWDFQSTTFANALDEIAKTVNPDARPYPKVRL